MLVMPPRQRRMCKAVYVVVDSQGYVYIASTLRTALIRKINLADGSVIWTHGATGTADELKLAIDANDNVYLAGTFKNTVDFDPGTGVVERTSNGAQDMYLLQLNPN